MQYPSKFVLFAAFFGFLWPSTPSGSLSEMVPDHTLEPRVSRSETRRRIQLEILATQSSLTSAETVAKLVEKTASCYRVDPFVFTALIWRESRFNERAVSPTGAIGFAQLTLPGVREVLDRVRPRGHRRMWHARKLLEKCNPELFHRLPSDSGRASGWWTKAIIAQNPEWNLAMGALLFKIQLSAIPKLSQHPERLFDHYRKALERYNGDQRVKVRFAKEVLQKSQRLHHQPVWVTSENSKSRLKSVAL